MIYIFCVILVVCCFYVVHTLIEIYKSMDGEFGKREAFECFCKELSVGDVFEENGVIVYNDPFFQIKPQTLTVLEIKDNQDGEMWVLVEVSCEGVKLRKSMKALVLYEFYKKQ